MIRYPQVNGIDIIETLVSYLKIKGKYFATQIYSLFLNNLLPRRAIKK